MKEIIGLILLIVCLGIAHLNARALDQGQAPSTHPYDSISNRNLFALKTPVVRTDSPPPILPKIRLTGITTVGGRKLAFLKMQPIPNPDATASEECMLAAGQRSGEIEVIDIDDRARRVRIKVSGILMDLTFAGPLPLANPPAR